MRAPEVQQQRPTGGPAACCQRLASLGQAEGATGRGLLETRGAPLLRQLLACRQFGNLAVSKGPVRRALSYSALVYGQGCVQWMPLLAQRYRPALRPCLRPAGPPALTNALRESLAALKAAKGRRAAIVIRIVRHSTCCLLCVLALKEVEQPRVSNGSRSDMVRIRQLRGNHAYTFIIHKVVYTRLHACHCTLFIT